MFWNQFSVRVMGGNEREGGYVDMRHGQQYSLQMRNSRQERCDARVEIDGQHVGTWRIESLSSINIDRPAHDTGRFTFYRLGSPEGQQAALDSVSPDLGLVRVTFTPEVVARPIYSPGLVKCSRSESPTFSNASFGMLGGRGFDTEVSRSAGGTGLSGQSQQRFGTARSINYDYEQQTVINLRLVCVDDNGPRPLTARATPVPPRLA